MDGFCWYLEDHKLWLLALYCKLSCSPCRMVILTVWSHHRVSSMCPGARTMNNMWSNQPQALLGGLTTMFLSPSGPCSISRTITAFLSYCINTGYNQERFRGKLSLVYWFLNKNAREREGEGNFQETFIILAWCFDQWSCLGIL